MDKVFTGLVLAFSVAMLVPLATILGFILVKGAGFIKPGLFLFDESRRGILHAIMGSFIIVGIASAIAIPIAVLTGLYLSEAKPSRISTLTRVSVDVLQGLPSIVVGILAYIWLVVPLRHNSAWGAAWPWPSSCSPP